MGFSFRRRIRLDQAGTTHLNVSKTGASVSHTEGPVTLNTRGRLTIRTPIKGLTFRWKL